MSTKLIGMLAETSIHPGSGQDAGFVDLPVAREKATDCPVIVGSSLKGALKDAVKNGDSQIDVYTVFGKQEDAGELIVGDARLLLLPIRSLQGNYRWATSNYLINRFNRDRNRAGLSDISTNIQIDAGESFSSMKAGERLFLEERQFECKGSVDTDVIDAIAELIPSMKDFLADRMVVLCDDDFAWFARFGLCVTARNQLDEEKKTSKNLWYEETLPPDSVFYCLLSDRTPSSDAADPVTQYLSQTGYLQVGGNQTVGQGVFAVTVLASQSAQELSI